MNDGKSLLPAENEPSPLRSRSSAHLSDEAKRWMEENHVAIDEYNEWYAENGSPLDRFRSF